MRIMIYRSFLILMFVFSPCGFCADPNEANVVKDKIELSDFSNSVMRVQTRVPARFSHGQLEGVIRAIENKQTVPYYKGATDGYIEMQKLSSIQPPWHKELEDIIQKCSGSQSDNVPADPNSDRSSNTTSTSSGLQENDENKKIKATWVANVSSQGKGEGSAASDTEIVGGVKRDQISATGSEKYDLIIKVSGSSTNPFLGASATDQIALQGLTSALGSLKYKLDYSVEWRLNLSDDGSTSGILVGEIKTVSEEDNGASKKKSATSSRFEEDGRVIKELNDEDINTGGVSATNYSKSVFYPDGRVEETRKFSTSEGVSKSDNSTKQVKPFKPVEKWFSFRKAFLKNSKQEVGNTGVARDEEIAKAREGATFYRKSALIVNGKKFEFEVMKWNKDTAHLDSKSKPIRIYLPNSPNPNVDDALHFANELGNLIVDARDGVIDDRYQDRNGNYVSELVNEAYSDKFSAEMGKFFQDPENVKNPLADYLPTDKDELSVFDEYFSLRDMGMTEMISYYAQRANTLVKADELVKTGKYKEAYELLKNSGYEAYACRVVGASGFYESMARIKGKQ